MNKAFYYFFFILVSVLIQPAHLYGQEKHASAELQYDVSKILPYITVSREKLKNAQILPDINRHFKPSWIRTYISVDVWTTFQGKPEKASGKSATFSPEQKAIMERADAASEILVTVKYIPENTLRIAEVKELDFNFTVDPDREAAFVGGKAPLMQYLKENAIDKIPEGVFSGYMLAAVKFTVNEGGAIENVYLSESSKDEMTDALLLETVRNMPCWTPAEYANGLNVKQEFAFMVGNMKSCVINLLNVRESPEQ